MKYFLSVLTILLLATLANAQIQVRWNVELAAVTDRDSVRHLTLLPEGKVAVWGGNNITVYDTSGVEQWQWHYPAGDDRVARILNVALEDDVLYVAFNSSAATADTANVQWLWILNLNGNNVRSWAYPIHDFHADFAVTGPNNSYFAGLRPALSLAPHGVALAVSNDGDSLWFRDVLPYTMDNVNRITSARSISEDRMLITGTTGLPGESANLVVTVSSNGTLTSIPEGSTSSVVLWDALPMINGQRWVIGVQEADVMRQLWIDGVSQVLLPLAQGIEFFGEDAVVAAPEGGILLAGHIGGHATASSLFLIRVGSALTTLWTDTLSGYDRFTDIIVHPDGGYLAVAIEDSPARFHLVRFTESADEIDAPSSLSPYPLALSLSAYPNPFNPITQIAFTLPQAQRAKLEIFNILGGREATLADGYLDAGDHAMTFDASDLPSGLYFARLSAGQKEFTQKLIFVK